MSGDGADHSEMSMGNVISRLALAIRECSCHRLVIGSQIMGSCDRCAAEQTAAKEIMRLRDALDFVECDTCGTFIAENRRSSHERFHDYVDEIAWEVRRG